MPTVIQPELTSPVGKNSRRNRRRRSRARRLTQQTSLALPTRPPTKRRRLCYQDSLDPQEVLDECHDLGIRLDQDVHVGHAVSSKGNPFSILDLDTANTTTASNAPTSDSINSQSGGTALGRPRSHSSPRNPEMKDERVGLEIKAQYRPNIDADLPSPPSALGSTISTATDAAPRYSGPGNLNDIHIPSPKLFEDRYRSDLLARCPGRDLPSFELPYSQPYSQPAHEEDLGSYRPTLDTDRLSEDGLSTGRRKRKFVSASSQQMGLKLAKPDTGHHNPISFGPFSLINNYALAGTLIKNHNPLKQTSHTDIDQRALSGRSPISEIGGHSRQSLSYPQHLLDFRRVGPNEDNALMSPKLPPSTSYGHTVSARQGFGRCDHTSNCTDFVLVKQDAHQPTEWPTEKHGFPSSVNASSTPQPDMAHQKPKIGNVLKKKVDWSRASKLSVNLSISDDVHSGHDVSLPQPPASVVTATERSQPHSEQDPGDTTVAILEMIADHNGCHDHTVEDEAYHTAEDDTDIEIVIDTQSDEEWADWEWDFESPDAEEGIELHATDREVKAV